MNSVDNRFWRAGVCRGFSGGTLDAAHSAAFLDGYDYGKRLRQWLKTTNESHIPTPLNLRSSDIRGILEENRALQNTVRVLEAKLSA